MLKSIIKMDTIENQLVTLGLSKDTARCYLALVKKGALTSHEIASELRILPNSVYRLLHSLEKRKIVAYLHSYPLKYQAVPLQVAITTLANSQIKQLEAIKDLTLLPKNAPNDSSPHTRLDILTGWKSMMNKYVELAKTATEEILIISIGESVPDEVKIANRDALEREVSIKFIVHTHSKQNEALLRSWIKMGIATRYYKESGYHLVVVDGKKCILTTSNPNNSQERISVVIYGEGLSRAMQQHFYTLWARSLPIKVV